MSPRPKLNTESFDDVYFTEKRWALCGILVSCSVIITKLLHMYGEALSNFILERKLVQIEHLTDDGQIMLKHMYQSTVKYSSIWLPVLCGMIATYITWITVYLDSDVPGIQPPTPLSPNKYKRASGHAFHLSYIFALVIGATVTYYMYANNVQIVY